VTFLRSASLNNLISSSENPHRTPNMGTITIRDRTENGRTISHSGPERQNIDDLFDFVRNIYPDLILFPDYDRWSSYLREKPKSWGLSNTFSRTGKFRSLSQQSYFSYGWMEHRLWAEIPEGRMVVDTRQSFMYREGDRDCKLITQSFPGMIV